MAAPAPTPMRGLLTVTVHRVRGLSSCVGSSVLCSLSVNIANDPCVTPSKTVSSSQEAVFNESLIFPITGVETDLTVTVKVESVVVDTPIAKLQIPIRALDYSPSSRLYQLRGVGTQSNVKIGEVEMTCRFEGTGQPINYQPPTQAYIPQQQQPPIQNNYANNNQNNYQPPPQQFYQQQPPNAYPLLPPQQAYQGNSYTLQQGQQPPQQQQQQQGQNYYYPPQQPVMQGQPIMYQQPAPVLVQQPAQVLVAPTPMVIDPWLYNPCGYGYGYGGWGGGWGGYGGWGNSWWW